jgi:hypothetical protein
VEREFGISIRIEVNQMAVTGITDSMYQYERATEVIYNNKPKYSKPHGIKRPDTKNIVAALTGLFLVSVLIAQFM